MNSKKKEKRDSADEDFCSSSDEEEESGDDDDDDAYSLKSSYDAEVACKHMDNPPAFMAKLSQNH